MDTLRNGRLQPAQLSSSAERPAERATEQQTVRPSNFTLDWANRAAGGLSRHCPSLCSAMFASPSTSPLLMKTFGKLIMEAVARQNVLQFTRHQDTRDRLDISCSGCGKEFRLKYI